MIKHEEVVKALANIRSNTTIKTTSHSIGNFLDTDLIEFDRDNLKKDYQIIETYITEQEKKDERHAKKLKLLMLYRMRHNYVVDYMRNGQLTPIENSKWEKLDYQILKLEEELK